jgi:hypothetical protein
MEVLHFAPPPPVPFARPEGAPPDDVPPDDVPPDDVPPDDGAPPDGAPPDGAPPDGAERDSLSVMFESSLTSFGGAVGEKSRAWVGW